MDETIERVRRKKKKTGFRQIAAELGFGEKKTSISQAAKKKLELDDIDRQRRADNEELVSANKPTLNNVLAQSGLGISKEQFMVYSLISGAAAFIIANVLGLGLFGGIPMALFFTFAAPRWYVLYKRNKRFKAFTNGLPNALESIVRNLKSGIPALEAIKILAREAKEPIRAEFAILVQEQGMGLTLAHAFERMAIRVPIEEARFLAITVEIQAQSGGNLSEILMNLANVLRERRKLRQKIHSMTSESRAGAMIVGGIPFGILGALAVVQPSHTNFFFEDTVGIFALIGSIVWQCIGVFVMWKMTNFKI